MSTLVSIFGCTTTGFDKLSFLEVNSYAVQIGYFVTPDAANTDTYAFLTSNFFNPNATLHKSWSTIANASTEELIVKQLMHYISTYGTHFTGEPLTFNDGQNTTTFENFTIIDAISNDEMYEKCIDMLKSGAALDTEDVKVLTKYVTWYIKRYRPSTDGLIDSIANKEARILLMDELDIYPSNGADIVKYLVYKVTGKPVLIQNKETIDAIKSSRMELPVFADKELKALASCFLRFKPIMLAFKQANSMNRYTVNLLRRMAKKYHTPMKVVPSMRILESFYDDFENLDKELHHTTNFRLVSLLNYLNAVMESTNDKASLYIIRNGKCFAKEALPNEKALNVKAIFQYVKNILVENLRPKAGVVKYHPYLTLACPTSTKNFVGNFPFGTSIKMRKNNYMGIYWENAWGTHDFDLSFISQNGGKIGWNARYCKRQKNQLAVLYSGDMTDAPNGAAEVILMKNNYVEDGLFFVNRYFGDEYSTFMLFGGTTDDFDMDSPYMVDKKTIKFTGMCESINKESLVGYHHDGQLYFMSLPFSETRVSLGSSLLNETLFNALNQKIKTYTMLKDILDEAGFIEFNPDIHKEPDSIDYDFENLHRDDLIALFS